MVSFGMNKSIILDQLRRQNSGMCSGAMRYVSNGDDEKWTITHELVINAGGGYKVDEPEGSSDMLLTWVRVP